MSRAVDVQLLRELSLAISDPGHFLPREDVPTAEGKLETVSRWGARAVATIVEQLLASAASTNRNVLKLIKARDYQIDRERKENQRLRDQLRDITGTIVTATPASPDHSAPPFAYQARQWADEGARVECFSGRDPSHVLHEGRIIGMTEAPTVRVLLDDGRIVSWVLGITRKKVAKTKDGPVPFEHGDRIRHVVYGLTGSFDRYGPQGEVHVDVASLGSCVWIARNVERMPAGGA